MPGDLQSQLTQLRAHLDEGPTVSDEERAELQRLIDDIELKIAAENSGLSDPSLVDGVNLAVERFEVAHPRVAGTLRNIVQSLANMGI